MHNSKFEVIVLATDIFGYYWAHSFHKQYQKKVYALGNFESPYTELSNLFNDIRIEKDLFDEETFVKAIIDYTNDIKENHPEKEVILIPTNDHFVRYIIQNAKELEKHCLFNVPRHELLDQLMLKENFYETMRAHNLPIPKTIFQPAQEAFTQDFDAFPAIIKPSSSVGWKGLDFAEYEKVYYCEDKTELERILDAIRETSYDHNLIIQEFIEGNDTNLWDIVTYSNKEGKVQFITMGQVLLQEPAKNMVGNYTALIARYNRDVMESITTFLNDIGYTGFANFDLKLDPKDNTLKLFEVNLRAGRSNFSADQMGESLAKNMVDDLIFNQSRDSIHYVDEANLFTYVPKYVIKKYLTDPELKAEVKQLIKDKKINNPLDYHRDRSMKRSAFLNMRGAKFIWKYRNGTWNKSK